MNPQDIKKLLGGYATGTLTEEEQQALFAAALEDQELFDALAGEEPLRDLMSDPAARAELLSALDAPAGRRGFWRWVRRPAFAGLAAAGVAAIGVLIVWQGTRTPSVPAAKPVIVAELKQRDVAPAAPVAQPAAMPAPRAKKHEAVARMAPLPTTPPPPPPALPEAPAPAAAPLETARKEKDAIATLQPPTDKFRAVQENVALDARALFYANPLPGANGFVQTGNGAVQPRFRAAAPRTDGTSLNGALADRAAAKPAAAPRLGVRVSILRGAAEAEPGSVLDPGEAVRLRLTPNTDGFLYLTDGEHLLASGAAQRFKPFESPEVRFEGQKQLYVLFSRRPQTVDPASPGALPGGKLLESAGPDRATYFVNGPPETSAAQIVVPVTLTWR